MATTASNSTSRSRVLEQFSTDGYLHAANILTPSVVNSIRELMYGELERQKAEFLKIMGFRLDDAEAVKQFLDSQSDLASWFANQNRDLQHLLKGEYPLDFRLHEDFKFLASEKELVGLMQELIGDDSLRFHYPPMLRFKIPKASQALVPLHQDYPYFPHLSYFLNIWIPLCEITDECGGVNVVVGSHEIGRIEHKESALWGKYIDREHVEGYVDKHVTMKLGDALIFGPQLVHYTHANTSSQVRCSIDTRWFAHDVDSSRQYFDVNKKQVIKAF